MLRTHTCGELRLKDNKKEVTLCGWVQSRRDHGGVIFIDLRDRYGLTQAVFDPSHNNDVHNTAEKLGREYVLKITGKVRPRGKKLENSNLNTGQIELLVDSLEILNESETPPFEIDDRKEANEDLRLKYRYMDLRRPRMQNQLKVRHLAVNAARKYLNAQGFLEIETPMLVRATPEGARDFVVPSRIHPGQFYALPQSPQIYKQILMVSGFDRYYQIARCLRDEDSRKDRQPEFTQIDIEMSFCNQEDVFEVCEGMFKLMFKEALDFNLKIPFPKITYNEAMNKYGTDKPDLRFGLELDDVSDLMEHSDFGVFKSVIDKGGVVKVLNVKECADFSRKDIEELTEIAKVYHAQGLAWIKVGANKKLDSSIVKFLSDDIQVKLVKQVDAKEGDLLLFVADTYKIACTALGQIRLVVGNKKELIDKSKFQFVWIVDFPLFEWNEDEERYEPAHHMFTMPNQETLQYLESEPSKVIAQCYDLVLNGVEVCSGSIRIHRKDIQERVMKAMGISQEEAELKFGFMLNAFKYGAPPHGGIAPGLDRVVSLMCGYEDIKEVLAFPKNKQAIGMMDGSPSSITDAELKELHIKMDIKKKK